MLLAFAVARRRLMGGSGAPDDLDQAHRTQVWLAVSENCAAQVAGEYFYHRKLRSPHPAAHDTEQQEMLLAAVAVTSQQEYGVFMQPHKIWKQQCQATKQIRRRYGAKSALDYFLSEKLMRFSEEARRRPEFEQELPRFLAAVWQVFNTYEIAGYVASQKPRARKTLRALLYLR